MLLKFKVPRELIALRCTATNNNNIQAGIIYVELIIILYFLNKYCYSYCVVPIQKKSKKAPITYIYVVRRGDDDCALNVYIN